MKSTDRTHASLPLRYRVLLFLLPAHVRHEHQTELLDELATNRPTFLALAADMLRAAPGAHWDVFRQDLTLAWRQMRRAPAFACIAGLTLAIGIGANIAFFTLVEGVLLRQLPFTGANRIVDITEQNIARGLRDFGMSPANFRDLANDSSLFQAAAMYGARSGTALLGDNRERVTYSAVGGDFFRVFTEQTITGRTLAPEDDVPGDSIAVLAYDFWRRAFGNDPLIVGRYIDIDGNRLRIVGVMPAGFSFPRATTQFWTPLGLSDSERANRGGRSVNAVARLRAGITIDRAATAVQIAARQLAAKYTRTNDGWSAQLRELRASMVDDVRAPLFIVWIGGGLVLLIAIANVASLFIARAVTREREVALRAALGARTGRLVRQLVTEGLVLSVASATVGLGIAQVVLAWVRPLASSFLPRMGSVAIGPWAIAYAVLLVLITTALLSTIATSPVRGTHLASAFGNARSSISRGRRRLQRGIVIAEVALAVFVLIGSALVTRTLAALLAQPMGFAANEALTFRIEPPWRVSMKTPDGALGAAIAVDRTRANEGYSTLLAELRAQPGVRAAGAINRVPLTGDWWTTSLRLPEQTVVDESQRIPVYERPVTPGYFEAMGTRVLHGRGIESRDIAGGPLVVVVDAELARRAWGAADPIGQAVLLDGPPKVASPAGRVVGVVESTHMNRLDADSRGTMYVPFAQAMTGHYLNWGMDVVVRGAPALGETTIRSAVRHTFPDAAVFRIAPMQELVDQSTSSRRFQLFALTFFGVLALLLATIGVGGALLLSVREQRSELAIRMALGARPGALWWHVQGGGLALAGFGALLGLAAAVTGARVFSSVVYGVSVRDPISLLAGPVLMLLAAFIATAIPATRAVTVAPTAALRE